MSISEFERKLQELHSDFAVIIAKPGNLTASVLFRGEYMFAIGANGIFEHPSESYGIDLPNGKYIRHRTLPEAMAMANKIVRDMKEGSDQYDAMMGLGKYSNASLAAGDEPPNIILP